ncbi:complement decay-accelerating factor, GPI-anchored-like [Pristis pectinata]|uniref:complement decay-accelerating factor, GPI-anchored-like n=1 Tax=Pristis pectinata TaxID=685728 RepID=UPI00223CE49E|nr:complement decay-accelerating factor, GPI-anchored-like [Pristis pectinata]
MAWALLLVLLAAARAAADCGNPPHLENGSPTDEFLSLTSFPVGTKVLYRCNPGYAVHERSSASVSCEEDLTWTPLDATCERVDCSNPEGIENGFYEAPSTTFGSVAIYHCNEGYKMSGGGMRLCSSDGWTGQVPTCRVSSAVRILNEMITFGHELITKEENVIKSYYHLLETERELHRSKEKLLHKAEQYVNENLV